MTVHDVVRSLVPNTVRSRGREWYYRLAFRDRRLIEAQFREAFGRPPNLEDPQTFNEKLQWLKLYWRDDLARTCADKAEVRDYVAARLGPQRLNKVYGIFDSVDGIPWERLPTTFIVKATHGSGWNMICKDREVLDVAGAKRTMRSWLRGNLYWKTREWVYKDIRPRLVIEELLITDEGHVPADYKVFCFHGEPAYIQVDIDRFRNHRRNIYDTEWRLLPFSLKYPNDPRVKPSRPPLEEILACSRALAQPFPHVRVDWFIWNGSLRFGEMTFFHGMGRERFSPAEWDLTFGRRLDLSRL